MQITERQLVDLIRMDIEVTRWMLSKDSMLEDGGPPNDAVNVVADIVGVPRDETELCEYGSVEYQNAYCRDWLYQRVHEAAEDDPGTEQGRAEQLLLEMQAETPGFSQPQDR